MLEGFRNVEEYRKLKALVLKSAQDFLALYDSVPDKNGKAASEHKNFYGKVPRSVDEMYAHTKNVNEYYFWRFMLMLTMTEASMRAANVDLRPGSKEGFF